MIRRPLVNMAKALMPGQNVEKEIPIFRIANPYAMQKNTRLIDPQTGLPYGEVNQLIMEGLMSIEGDPETAQFNITEIKEYQFKYK